MTKILITRDIAAPAEAYLKSRGFFVTRRETAEGVCRPEELAGFDGVLSMGVHYSGETIRANPQLRILALGSAGVDFVDIAAAKAQGVAVTNAPNANARSVAEQTALLILACVKDLAFSERCIRLNDWSGRLSHYAGDLAGMTLGVLGFGHIGREVAQIMRDGFHMEVLAYRRPGSRGEIPEGVRVTDSLDALYSESDVLSIHVPLTPETAGMVGEAAFRRMKPTAVLVNCARGRVVDQRALVRALTEGQIAFAGLDVLEQEPPAPDDPILRLPNVILTPHNAAITRRTTERVCGMAAECIDAFFRGQPVPRRVC